MGLNVLCCCDAYLPVVLQNEIRFGATHVPFYHGQKIVHRVYQDILTGVYKAFGNSMPEDFVFLRFWHDRVPQKTAQEFIDAHQEKAAWGNRFDNDAIIARSVLSTTYSLFGNWSQISSWECAFDYYTSNKNVASYTLEALLEHLFVYYKFDTKYMKELVQAGALLKDDRGSMCQILIPKSCVERCVYISHPLGVPYSEPIKGIEGFDAYKKRYTGISSFLKYCCSNPEDIHNTIEGKAQARIVFVPEMLDPKSGVKVLRYTQLTPEDLKPYHDAITRICQQMVADMKHSKRGQ